MSDPIDNIVWLETDSLRANHWNPNRVYTPEMRLIEHSILTNGWIQPILVTRDGLVIDGFHRWTLARESEVVRKRWGGRVPCAVLDIGEDEAMALTVRINRAKGSHVAVHLHRLVTDLVERHLWTIERVCTEIGASRQEVDLLLKDGIFAELKTKDYAYSNAWYPADGPYSLDKGTEWARAQGISE